MDVLRDSATEDTREESVLTAMVTNDAVLASVASKVREGVFSSPWLQIVAKWCVKFHAGYNRAPNKELRSIFSSEFERMDPSDAKTIEAYLVKLSEKHERSAPVSTEYLLDLAADVFNRNLLEAVIEQARGDLSQGRTLEARKRIKSFSDVEIGQERGCHFLNDPDAIRDTFAQRERGEDLVGYRHGLGEFFHNAFERDCLVSFVGPPKVGKTWWLVDVAVHAARNRMRTAFFEVGDLSDRQIKERVAVSVCRHPSRSKDGKWPYVVKYPTRLDRPPKGTFTATVEHEEREFAAPINDKVAQEKIALFLRKQVKSRDKSFFHINTYANYGVNANGIRGDLDELARQKWIADVVVIDYIDNLSPVDSRMDVREQVNNTWRLLRKMATDYKCLVVTATQTNREGFNRRILEMDNLSEDVRKSAVANGIVGINQTDDEKELGLSRLNWVAKREGEYNPKRCCYVAGCLATGCPSILSEW